MPQQFDVSLKILFRYSRGIVAQAALGGEVQEWLNVELPAIQNPRVDLLARMADGTLRQLEFQAKNDAGIAVRLLEYYSGFWALLGRHVDQTLLYCGREPLRMPDRLDTPSLQFGYRLLNVREMDGEPLLASDDWGDNVLAILTRADREQVIRAVEAQIRRLAGPEQSDALQTFVILSGILGIGEQIRRRLAADMIDLMENDIIGPAIRKGLAEGLEQGRAQGRVEGMRKLLQRQLELRFGALPQWAQTSLEQATPEQLDAWGGGLFNAASLDTLLGR